MLVSNIVFAATALFGFAAASPIAIVESADVTLVEKSIIPRQAASIKTALLAAEQEAIKLRDAFSAATGTDPSEVDALRAQSTVLLNSINSATAVVANGPNLSLIDSLGLASTVQQLQKTVDSTLTVVVNKKPQVDSLGLTAEVHQTLINQKAAVDNFGTTFIGKVPTAAKGTAQGYIDSFDASFDKAIAAYA